MTEIKDHVKYDKVGIQPSAIKCKLIARYSNQELLLFGLIKSKIKIPPQLIYVDNKDKKTIILFFESSRIKVAEKRWREYLVENPSFGNFSIYFFKYSDEIFELIRNMFPKINILSQTINSNYIENRVKKNQLKFSLGKNRHYLQLINRCLKKITKEFYTGFVVN
jgi:hypothetical protein